MTYLFNDGSTDSTSTSITEKTTARSIGSGLMDEHSIAVLKFMRGDSSSQGTESLPQLDVQGVSGPVPDAWNNNHPQSNTNGPETEGLNLLGGSPPLDIVSSDKNGRPLDVDQANGVETTYSYDPSTGNVTEIKSSNGTDTTLNYQNDTYTVNGGKPQALTGTPSVDYDNGSWSTRTGTNTSSEEVHHLQDGTVVIDQADYPWSEAMQHGLDSGVTETTVQPDGNTTKTIYNNNGQIESIFGVNGAQIPIYHLNELP